MYTALHALRGAAAECFLNDSSSSAVTFTNNDLEVKIADVSATSCVLEVPVQSSQDTVEVQMRVARPGPRQQAALDATVSVGAAGLSSTAMLHGLDSAAVWHTVSRIELRSAGGNCLAAVSGSMPSVVGVVARIDISGLRPTCCYLIRTRRFQSPTSLLPEDWSPVKAIRTSHPPQHVWDVRTAATRHGSNVAFLTRFAFRSYMK